MARDKSGRSLEDAVGRIQKLLDPKSEVSYRAKISNRLGILREFDVVIKGTFGGQPMLGVIECKDWNKKVGTPEVDAFIAKTADINANMRMIVSAKGFTEQALQQAKHYGVGMFSLLRSDRTETGFTIGIRWYGRKYSWGTAQTWVSFLGDKPSEPYLHGEILYGDKPVQNVLLRELSTTYLEHVDSLALLLNCQFRKSLHVIVNGKLYRLSEFNLFVPRLLQKKVGFLPVSGDALYNWQTNTPLFPEEGGSFSIHDINFDMRDWADFDEKIPPLGNFQSIIDWYTVCIDPEKGDFPALPPYDLIVTRFGPKLDIT